MAILPIPKVVPDTDILADHFNRIIDGVQDLAGGHDHTGAVGHGKPVNHAHVINPGTHQHTGTGLNNTLDWHMDATQGSADHVLHGLPNNAYLVGSHVQQLTFTALEFTLAQASRVSHNCAGTGTAHVELAGWAKVYTAADLHLGTILGSACNVEGLCSRSTYERWPNPLTLRAGTYSYGGPHGGSKWGGWNEGLGTPDAASYDLIVPAGGLGIFLIMQESLSGSWVRWWNDPATQDNLGQVKVLVWGLP